MRILFGESAKFESAPCQGFPERCSMTSLRRRPRSVRSVGISFPTSKTIAKTAAVVFFATIICLAQDQPQAGPPPQDGQLREMQNDRQKGNVTIPAGTRLPLILTQPIESRRMRRGDDIYAQITSPVNSGNEVVIPPGTFIQGSLDKFERHGDRGELQLQSISITFPDGYVTAIPGPLMLETSEGYVLSDPGRAGLVGAFLPVVGTGLGIAIGSSFSSTSQSPNFPPGCILGSPGCVIGPTHRTNNGAFGAAIGGAAGTIVGLTLLSRRHYFLLAAGAPAEVTLGSPVSFPRDEISRAVKQSADQPVAVQPVAPPTPAPPPVMPVDHGTCWTPGTPGTPPTTIPGAPGPDGIPGPPTIITGVPPTPGTPYSCP